MLRRVLQLASLASLAGLLMLYPLFESLNKSFDSTVPASDLEIEAIVLLTFIGIVFVLAQLLASVAVIAFIDALRYLGGRVSTRIQMSALAFCPPQAPSPPLPLRI
jgi:hypothetical protein